MKTFFQALGNLFRAPATVKYPFEPTYKPEDYRGLIEHNPELCIWCRRCEISCPAGSIIFSQTLVDGTNITSHNRVGKLIVAMDGQQVYHYNRALCIYCGECVRVCPKDGALIQTATPGHPALAAENINKGWSTIVKDALESRAIYMAEKKKQKAASEEGGTKAE